MNYWITVHYPPWEGDKPSPLLPDPEYYYRIYLPDGRQSAGEELQPSDYVFIYESKTGKALKSGIRYRKGKYGVVALVKALSSIIENPESKPEEYLYSPPINWKWQVSTQIKELGFCSHDNVCKILEYSTDYTFLGFGDHHSGLKKLTAEQFIRLLHCFRACV